MKLIKHLWWRIHPDKFPRKQVWQIKWFILSYTNINFMYFRIHKHWPINEKQIVVSLKNKGFYNEIHN